MQPEAQGKSTWTVRLGEGTGISGLHLSASSIRTKVKGEDALYESAANIWSHKDMPGMPEDMLKHHAV